MPDTVTSNTDTEAVVITLIHGEKSEKIVTEKGNTITEEFLKAYITVEEGYEIDGFFTDDKFTNKFDFSKTIDADTSIYVKTSKIESEEEKDEVKDEIREEEKDDIPKTGEENYLGIAVLSILFSSIMAIGLTKKNSI